MTRLPPPIFLISIHFKESPSVEYTFAIVNSQAMKTAQRKQTKKLRMQNCDKALIDQFDYSPLSPILSKLAKPARRGLLNNGIRTPADLARRTVEEVTSLHGIGPSAMLILREALRKNGRSFKSPRR
jgi:hypothetical protein